MAVHSTASGCSCHLFGPLASHINGVIPLRSFALGSAPRSSRILISIPNTGCMCKHCQAIIISRIDRNGSIKDQSSLRSRSKIIVKCGSRIKLHQLQRGRHNNFPSEKRNTRNNGEPMLLVCSSWLINPSEIEPTDSATTHLHLSRVQHMRWRHHPAILLLHLPRRPCARTARQKDTRCRIHAIR